MLLDLSMLDHFVQALFHSNIVLSQYCLCFLGQAHSFCVRAPARFRLLTTSKDPEWGLSRPWLRRNRGRLNHDMEEEGIVAQDCLPPSGAPPPGLPPPGALPSGGSPPWGLPPPGAPPPGLPPRGLCRPGLPPRGLCRPGLHCQSSPSGRPEVGKRQHSRSPPCRGSVWTQIDVGVKNQRNQRRLNP